MICFSILWHSLIFPDWCSWVRPDALVSEPSGRTAVHAGVKRCPQLLRGRDLSRVLLTRVNGLGERQWIVLRGRTVVKHHTWKHTETSTSQNNQRHRQALGIITEQYSCFLMILYFFSFRRGQKLYYILHLFYTCHKKG